MARDEEQRDAGDGKPDTGEEEAVGEGGGDVACGPRRVDGLDAGEGAAPEEGADQHGEGEDAAGDGHGGGVAGGEGFGNGEWVIDSGC